VYDIEARAPGYSRVTIVGVRVTRRPRRIDFELPPRRVADADLSNAAERVRAKAVGEAPAGRPPEWTEGVGPVVTIQGVTEVPRTIRVLMPDGEIVEMDTDEYLKGVVPSEMGYVFRRAFDALKAQAIASRTYAARTCLPETAGDPKRCERGLDANVDTTTRTQVWRPVHYEVSDAAVEETHGQVARHEGQLIPALFFARTTLRTLDSEDSSCCGGRAWPFLRSVSSPEAFSRRWGHGAGMSQEGAATFADWGADAVEIIGHYYTGVTVNPLGRPILYDGRAEPREAAAGQPVRFSVAYRDPDGDPPAQRDVVLGGRRYEMARSGGDEPDYRAGATFVLTATLAAGKHTVKFRFSDGYSEPVELDAGVVDVSGVSAASEGGGGRGETPPGVPEGLKSPVTAINGPPVQAGEVTFGTDVLDFEPAEVGSLSDEEQQGVTEAGEGMVQATTEVVETEFPFMALGARWQADGPGSEPLQLEVRTSRDGETWSRWIGLEPDNGDWKEPPRPDEHWTQLLVTRGEFVQLRASTPAEAARSVRRVTLHYMNADKGPAAPTLSMQAGAGDLRIISRAGWGADESLRFDSHGEEIWPPEYTDPRAQIVHHTVTANAPADPASVVRAIYYYHAVTRGWGDIGYNFLVDHRGNVYEGRFGGERGDRIVRGGHALQFNANTIGVAVLGTFTEAQQVPRPAAINGLVSILASKGLRFDIEPFAPVRLVDSSFPYSILGHRDVLPGHTVCPGDGLYARLGHVRTEVKRMMDQAPPATASRPPLATATATATRRLQTVTPSPTVTPAPTWTDTPAPDPDCAELVVDGGFEHGSDHWMRSRAYFTKWDVYRGDWAVFVGLRDNDPDQVATYASVTQAIEVPADVGSATLTFVARTVGYVGDSQVVRLLDEEGAVIALGDEALPLTSTWTEYEFDVSEALRDHAGEQIRLHFAVSNDGDGRRSYMRIDEVSLIVCGGGSTPVAPTSEATAAPTASPSPSPGPAPTASLRCASLIRDGGFESSTLPTWRLSGGHQARQEQSPTHSGEGALRLGPMPEDDDTFDYAAVDQSFSPPAAVESARLTLWIRPLEVSSEDAFIVELRRPGANDGTRIRLLGPQVPGEVGSWLRVERAIDPELLQGTMELYIALLNRGQSGEQAGGPTALMLDDVAFEVCFLTSAAQRYVPHVEKTARP